MASRLKGRSALRVKLSIILPKEIKKGVQEAIGDSLDIVHSDALRNVPVDEGDLAAALGKQQRGDKLGGQVGFWKKGNKRRWERAGWRSHFTEYGTRGYKAGARRKNSSGGKVGTTRVKKNIPARKARPFLGPAFTKNRRWIERRINRAVDKALKRAGSHGK